MKAITCKSAGLPENLVFEEVKEPEASPGKALVKVHACGVNYPDTLIIQGKYQFRPPMPFSPGGEIAGVIEQTEENEKGLKAGDHVFAVTGWGGFAEKVSVPVADLVKMPRGTAFETAAVLSYTYGTVLHGLKDRADLQPGETLLVLGAAGGVGTAAIELGQFMGARVIAAASSAQKLETCARLGADELVNYAEEDLKQKLKELTGGKGVDVVMDPVGGAWAEPAYRATGWKGRYLVAGFAAGEIPALPLNLPLLKGSSLMGVFFSAFRQHEPAAHIENLQQLASMLQKGQIKPEIEKVYPLEQASEALRRLMDRQAKGKLVLVTGAVAAD